MALPSLLDRVDEERVTDRDLEEFGGHGGVLENLQSLVAAVLPMDTGGRDVDLDDLVRAGVVGRRAGAAKTVSDHLDFL
jgi:hypothetical protein